jgi:adenylate cyclase
MELAATKLVIVAWSPASVASENVKAEARWARQQGRLLQVFVEACEPPLFFGERQGVDLKHWSGAASDAAFRSVLDAVRQGLESASAPSEAAVLSDAPFALPTKPSIAVLPFANVSGDPEQEYFADGMLLEIVEALSRIKSIFVIASGSSLSFKGKGVTAQDAARQLGVRYVLEGSVRKAGNRVRIGVQLVDAADGTSIWTERFEDTFDDVFALQDKVALAVAGRIEPTVRQAESRRASKRPTENMGSYDLYLRAFAIAAPPLKEAELLEAIQLLDGAIALDPDFGPALATAALNRWLVVAFGWSADPAEELRQSVELAHRALKVGGDDAQVLSMVASIIAFAERDLAGGIALSDRALALNPGSAAAWFSSCGLRLANGDADLAIEHVETSMRLDPLGPDRLLQISHMGNARFAQRRFGEALTCYKEFVQQQPENHLAQLAVAATYAHLGQLGAAREALEVYRTLTSAPASEALRRWSTSQTPEVLKLFLDGIAVAEGKSLSDTPADAR